MIKNKIGEAGIDNDLLYESKEQIVEMHNCCICCTVRGDLMRSLGELGEHRAEDEIDFDRIIIETTGLADPAPIAQTFLVDPAVIDICSLYAIITIVDAKHGPQQLDTNTDVQEQVGFADRILLSKTDLVEPAAVERLSQGLRAINPRETIIDGLKDCHA